MTGIEGIKKNLSDYKRKYYINKLLRGVLIFSTLLLSYYLIIASIEYTFRFNSMGRTILLFSFIAILLYVGYKWIGDPLFRLLLPQKQITDEEAAQQIGNHFPEISDKLLNTIQLQKSNAGDSSLIMASITQRTNQLSIIPFPKAIDLSKNKVYLKYLAIPTVVIALVALILPQLITESTGRIIKFQTEFVPEAPFTFQVENNSLTAFRNEDFVLKVSTEGNAQPNQAFAVIK
ncbi:MAG: ATPase, partial [Cyclobacteriaceae bacterium]